MKRQIDIKVKSNYTDKYKNGYPLIYRSSIQNIDKEEKEGTILNLLDEKGEFIARGYYGVQNKGVGWLFTRKKDEEIGRASCRERV